MYSHLTSGAWSQRLKEVAIRLQLTLKGLVVTIELQDLKGYSRQKDISRGEQILASPSKRGVKSKMSLILAKPLDYSPLCFARSRKIARKSEGSITLMSLLAVL